MCIRTLYGKNKKVVGLLINGKQFLLNREVCNALRMEELKTKRNIKSTTAEASSAKKELESEIFTGESELLDIKVSFGAENQINSKSAIVEFKNKLSEISEEKRIEYTEVLESFLKALNQANKSHCLKTEETIKSIVSKNKEAS